MDQEIEPQLSLYNTFFIGGTILWIVLSSIAIYIQYSTVSSSTAEENSHVLFNYNKTSKNESVKRSSVNVATRQQINLGTSTPTSSRSK